MGVSLACILATCGWAHAQNHFPVAIPNGDFTDPANEGTAAIPPSVLGYEETIGNGPWKGWGSWIPHPVTSIANGRATVSGLESVQEPGTAMWITTTAGFRQYAIGETYNAGWTYVLTVRVSADEPMTEAALEVVGVDGALNLNHSSLSAASVTIFNNGEHAILESTYVAPASVQGVPISIYLTAGATGAPTPEPIPVDMLGDIHFEEVSLVAIPPPPQLQCPTKLYLTTSQGCMAVVPPVTVPVVPGSSPFTNFTYSQIPAAGSLMPTGKGWIHVTVTDPFGNTTSCAIPVQVIDATPPVVSGVSLEPVDTCTGAIPDITGLVWAEDNCTPFDDLQITQTPAPGTPVGPGTHVIQVAVTDSSSNTGYALITYTVAPSQATDPITLHNTGMDAPGNPATPGGADAHYVMTVSADTVYPGPTAHVIDPVPAMWLANGASADSQWISASRDDIYIPASGTYVFRQEFTLPQGFTGASISGRWMSDNAAEIHLNGVPTGQTTPAGGYTAWTPFALQSGFVEGINTLDFVVESLSVFGATSYSGVRVEMSGHVTYCDNPCIPPYIISQPVNTYGIHMPGEAIFSVAAGGTGPLTYQWHYNGVPIAGATGPALIAAIATINLPGSYHAVVTNGCGQQTVSDVATRYSPFAVGHAAWWSGGLVAATSTQPGGSLTYLDAGAASYNRTEFLTRFGMSDTFGIPGISGLPVPVMRVHRTSPEMGYILRGDVTPGSGRHSFAFDILVPPEQMNRKIPLLQANPENTDAADLYLYAVEGDHPMSDDTVIIPGYEWVRIEVTVAPNPDGDLSVIRWFVNGKAQGSNDTLPIRWMPPESISTDSDGSDDPGTVPMEVLLFTDFSEVDFHLYVAHVAWWDRTLADFEINSLGSPRRDGIRLRDFTEPEPRLTIQRVDTVDPDAGDEPVFSYRWFGEGMRLQQSTDLIEWETYPGFPAMELIDGRMHNEVELIVDPTETSDSGEKRGFFMRLQLDAP